jgi:hypothetical protein
VRGWLTPKHSTLSLFFSIRLARFSRIAVDMVGGSFVKGSLYAGSIPRFVRACNVPIYDP